MSETLTKSDVLINSIMEYVPQVTFVIEQIGQALNIAKANYSETELEEILTVTVDVAKYAKEVSNSEAFFKYHLIVISLLQNINDMSKLSMFETQSNTVINGIQAIKPDVEQIKAKGFVKATVVKLAKLFKENQDLFALEILNTQMVLNNLITNYNKTRTWTNEELILLMQIAMIEQTIRMNKFTYLSPVANIVNNLLITLNKVKF